MMRWAATIARFCSRICKSLHWQTFLVGLLSPIGAGTSKGLPAKQASYQLRPYPPAFCLRILYDSSMTSFRASRRTFIAGLGAAATGLPSTFAVGQSHEKVTFGTSWVAQAEHGGYYQAFADGTYAKHGLDVTIIPGGPQANNRMQVMLGRIDFYMDANLNQAFSAVEQDIPTVVIATIFQKDPQVLIAHPGQGIET